MALCLVNFRERSYGVVLADDVLREAATDEEGVAVLPRPLVDADAAYVLRARAEGHVAGRLPWLDADEGGLALSSAESSSDRVVDANGRPVADVSVTATAVGAPSEVWGLPLTPWTATRAEAVTDGQGRFVLDGLEQRAYQLGVQQMGWALRRSRSRRPTRRTSGEENTQTVWPAGAEDVRLVVERIAVLTVHFRDPATGRELQPALSELSLALLPAAPWVAGGEVELSPHPYFDGQYWQDPSRCRHQPEVYRFVVPVRADAPLPLTVQLRYELYDELRGTAPVELHVPQYSKASLEGDGVRVLVDPEAALVGSCAVLVRETPPPPNEATGPHPSSSCGPRAMGYGRGEVAGGPASQAGSSSACPPDVWSWPSAGTASWGRSACSTWRRAEPFGSTCPHPHDPGCACAPWTHRAAWCSGWATSRSGHARAPDRTSPWSRDRVICSGTKRVPRWSLRFWSCRPVTGRCQCTGRAWDGQAGTSAWWRATSPT